MPGITRTGAPMGSQVDAKYYLITTIAKQFHAVHNDSESS